MNEEKDCPVGSNEYIRAERGVITIENKGGAMGGASLLLPGLPTSSSGLPPGSLWRDGNAIKIVT